MIVVTGMGSAVENAVSAVFRMKRYNKELKETLIKYEY